MAARSTALVIVFTLFLAGCANRSESPTSSPPTATVALPSAPPVITQVWESCAAADSQSDLAGVQALRLPPVPDGFRPVAAVICRAEQSGSRMVTVEERAGDVTALLATLRLPPEAHIAEVCTDDMPYVPWLVLLDAEGRWLRPGVPPDSCGKPRIEFRNAFRKLQTIEVARGR
ncbi:hypothetical protein OHA21_01150 [Actinoplanes sp. NBC_00393]|uniref:hypothetical protein n=1 Tax=Actinoplanes sp. NBC_00393 TaxID=2975953 RepID=UPI002E1A8D63